jgi:glutathione peroxidase
MKEFSVTTFFDFKEKTLDGKDQSLSDYKGKTLLVVNVASKCGLTPQYAGLQKLHDQYAARGFEVLGFPCNQFAGQEPGSPAEIAEFCERNYGVTFPLFAKIDVNGANRAPLYAWLTAQPTQPDGPGDILWNFGKFLIDGQGRAVARFNPRVAPDAPELVAALEKTLG